MDKINRFNRCAEKTKMCSVSVIIIILSTVFFLAKVFALDNSDKLLKNLIKATNRKDLQNMRLYIDALGEAKSASATDTLIELLKNKTPVIRWRTYIALNKIDCLQCQKAITAGLDNESEDFWQTFKEGIIGADKDQDAVKRDILAIGKPLLKHLQEMLPDENLRNRTFLQEIIKEIEAK